MGVTRIKFQSACPYGHEEIEYIDLTHRAYVFCYTCKKQYIQEDFEA